MAIDVSGSCPLLQVFDMPASIAFYCNLLGFEIVSQSRPGPEFDWVLLSLNGVELMLNTAYERDQRPSAPDARRIAAHDDTCIYFGCPDVDAAYESLRAREVNVKGPQVAPYGMKQLYIKDPDGYSLCFQWPATQAAYDDWVGRYGLEPKKVVT